MVITFIRRVLYTTAPTHAIFTLIRDPNNPQARAVQDKALRLKQFWYMDGLGTPTQHLITLLLAFKKPYETLILDLQKIIAKMNKTILTAGSKTLGAYVCTTLDAC